MRRRKNHKTETYQRTRIAHREELFRVLALSVSPHLLWHCEIELESIALDMSIAACAFCSCGSSILSRFKSFLNFSVIKCNFFYIPRRLSRLQFLERVCSS